jgi:hypothetical protein
VVLPPKVFKKLWLSFRVSSLHKYGVRELASREVKYCDILAQTSVPLIFFFYQKKVLGFVSKPQPYVLTILLYNLSAFSNFAPKCIL